MHLEQLYLSELFFQLVQTDKLWQLLRMKYLNNTKLNKHRVLLHLQGKCYITEC